MKILTDNGLMVLWQKIKDLYKKTSVSAKQTTTSTADGGTNVMTFTFGDGASTTLSVKNGSKGSDGARGATGAKGEKGDRGPKGETGPQGNSGIADASSKALINDAVTGGETSYLSAEVGKLGILTYDCSKGGTVEHASLQDAINAVPTTFRKAGISIIYKSGGFIYRYALKSNSWSSDSVNWFLFSDASDLFFSKYIANKKYFREIFIEGNAPDLYLTHFGIWNDVKYLNISDVNGETYATVFSKDADSYIVKEKNGIKIHILVDWNFASSTVNPELGDPTDDTKIKNANSLYTPCIQSIINGSNTKQNKHDITNIDNIINGYDTTVELEHVYLALGKYMVKSGKIVEYNSLSLAYYQVEKGAKITVDIPEQCNSAGYLIGYADIADGISDVIVDEGIGKGEDTQEHKNLNFIALYTKYLVVGYRTGSSVPSVTSSTIKKGLTERVSEIERKTGTASILSNKSIILFGDSLSAASTNNVNGFAKNIASYLNVPYRAFLYDSADGNTDDIDVNYPCLTNYAKDGTTNSTRDSRTDSVIERVKRHISNSTNVDYILIECCINDCSTSTKGNISESYTDSFDLSTTIGSIEETIRYITTLSKNIKLGFFIPWNISYIEPEWFDNYKQVFEKWSIPLLDLRKCAGFNFRNCIEHRKCYSLNSNSVDEWSSEKTYMLDEQVKYGGILYKCNKDNVIGILPTDSTTWTKMISGNYDGTHLNSLGHSIVTGKILSFIESL